MFLRFSVKLTWDLRRRDREIQGAHVSYVSSEQVVTEQLSLTFAFPPDPVRFFLNRTLPFASTNAPFRLGWDYTYTGGDPNGNLTGLADKRVGIIGSFGAYFYIRLYLANLYRFTCSGTGATAVGQT